MAVDAVAENSSGVEAMQDMMLQCARLDREINCFSDIVERLTSEASPELPRGTLPGLISTPSLTHYDTYCTCDT